ncbi:MAG: class I SAM-dependent methyltransferase [Actinomycetaceae bacterium]|nr:class I SAM-dependent methyltransferase [Actinomycetaceae bacterium]
MSWNARYREAIESGHKVFADHPASSVVSALNTLQQATGKYGHQPCAVDVGAGEGRHSRELVRRGYKVVALEPAESIVEHARENGIDPETDSEIHWVAQDMRNYTPPEPIDLALLCFMHQREFLITEKIDHLDSWIAPGGWIIFVGHSRAQAGLDVGGPSNPACLWDPEELSEALTAHGYRIERAENVTRKDIEKKEHAHHKDASIDAIVIAQKPIQ